jgi:16S rRNA (adenine1518-N6/adenine1519-N6)-dimethyltransferase
LSLRQGWALPTREELLKWTIVALRRLGVKPRERLGQHFLVDPRGIALFLEALAKWESNDMLEIGPGLGVITVHSSQIASRVIAVEIDPLLASHLASIASGNVVVIRGDGLDHVLSTCIKVVYSNTPYSISSQLVARIARNNGIVYSLLGVQLELARRMTAKPGEEDYGRLTLLTNRYFNVRLLGVIPRSSYYPEPEVSGAVVEMWRKKSWMEGDEFFESLTRCLFSSRNKKAVKIASRCLGVEPGKLSWLGERRVRELTLEDVEKLMDIVR